MRRERGAHVERLARLPVPVSVRRIGVARASRNTLRHADLLPLAARLRARYAPRPLVHPPRPELTRDAADVRAARSRAVLAALAVWFDFVVDETDVPSRTDPDALEVRVAVTCAVTIPVRRRCGQCALPLQGRVTAAGAGFCMSAPGGGKDALTVAEETARQDAVSQAEKQLRYARCPRCWYGDQGSFARFALEGGAAIASLAGVAAFALRAPLKTLWEPLVCFVATGLLGLFLAHRLRAWRRAPRLAPAAADPVARSSHVATADAPTADAEGSRVAGGGEPWSELCVGEARIASCFGINQALRDAHHAPGARARLPGCGARALLFVVGLAFCLLLVELDRKLGALAGGRGHVETLTIAWLLLALVGAWMLDATASPPSAGRPDEIGEFSLSLSPREFTVTGPGIRHPLTWPVAAIARFNDRPEGVPERGAVRPSLILRDGSEMTLPCAFPSCPPGTLSARLDEWLGECQSGSVPGSVG